MTLKLALNNNQSQIVGHMSCSGDQVLHVALSTSMRDMNILFRVFQSDDLRKKITGFYYNIHIFSTNNIILVRIC